MAVFDFSRIFPEGTEKVDGRRQRLARNFQPLSSLG